MEWDLRYSVGNETLDDQHRNILVQCNVLADRCLSGDGEEGDRQFNQSFAALMSLAREHFATEESLLTGCGYPDLEDQRFEYGEFERLVAEVATTEYFDKLELQRFLSLWWSGHIMGSVKRQRSFLEVQPST